MGLRAQHGCVVGDGSTALNSYGGIWQIVTRTKMMARHLKQRLALTKAVSKNDVEDH
jgi:hypothetical protein